MAYRKTEKVPEDQRCPNGERCSMTVGTWMSVPLVFNPKPGEKVFWPGNPTKCSNGCINAKYDEIFANGVPKD